MISKSKLREISIDLESALNKYCQDEKVRGLKASLLEIISKAKNGDIEEEVDSVPGAYWFIEGFFSQYPDLVERYSKFKNYLTIRDKDRYERIKSMAEDMRGKAK